MNKKRSVLRAGAVLAVALAAGHLVQSMNAGRDAGTEVAEAGQKPKAIEKVSAGPDAAGTDLPPALPATASLTPLPGADAPAPESPAETELAALTETDIKLPPLTTLPDLVAPKPAPAEVPAAPVAGTLPAPDTDCTPALSLIAGPQAMITLALTAACQPGERVVLRHAGLTIAERLDDSGHLSLDLPALVPAAEVSVLFDDATVLRASTEVPGAADLRRFAVQWMADDAFQLRVVEGDQDYGDAANVSAGAPVSPRGGFLVSLGDPLLDLPMMAQVYTWPADPALQASPLIEALVTDATCDRELLGEMILSAAGQTTVTDLTLAMPGCDAVGDILVLNNLVQDVTLASGN